MVAAVDMTCGGYLGKNESGEVADLLKSGIEAARRRSVVRDFEDCDYSFMGCSRTEAHKRKPLEDVVERGRRIVQPTRQQFPSRAEVVMR